MKLKFKNIGRFLSGKHFWSKIIILGTALVVALVLLYGNFSILKVLSFFTYTDQYKNSIVLFYGTGCDQCVKVDSYIAANKIDTKIQFIELEVFGNSANKRALIDKAAVCGLDEAHLGVPLIWDGPQKKCAVGYLDVINFLKAKAAEASKKVPKP